ncbi:class I SAM-dependent rRNA methyltransferase [Litorivicinus lipolyticus]|nr:class I SAM-dependent rRNA methyltransferase [Litorivicinus lipolyticus]
MTRPTLTLNPGTDRRIRLGYPWVFSNEIRALAENKTLEPGTLCQLQTEKGELLGMGTYNRHALIAFRLLDTNPEAVIDVDWFEAKLARAMETREVVYPGGYYRWIHSEADGIPGLIADLYGDAVSLQINTAGIEALRAPLLEAMDRLVELKTIILRGDTPQRVHEGLSDTVETLRGDGEAITLEENGLRFVTTLTSGQKTGWFYDQRDARALLAGLIERFESPTVFDGYCYAGGFSVAMAAMGARVTGVDRSAPALELAEQSAGLNDVSIEWIKADVFNVLERAGINKETYDLVNLDPPAFAKAKKTLGQGLRGYRKMTRMGAEITAPGGFLVIHSCSHHVTLDALIEQVARGLTDAKRTGQILFKLSAAADHPAMPQLPESQYLKGLVMRLN